MTDISMCANDKCTLKETCYRFKATPNKYPQSYSQFKQNKDKTCDFYYKIKNEQTDL